MEKIASFTINHNALKPGLYVSRVDRIWDETVSTFDLRFKKPNNAENDYISVPALHTIEHLGATYLRSHPEWKSKIVYFGPMGCRTGFYLLLAGEYTSKDILPLMKETFEWTAAFEGDIPGALPRDCGNYKEHSLPGAKAEAKAYAEILANATEENLIYPE